MDWDEPHGLKAITLRPGITHRSREEKEILRRHFEERFRSRKPQSHVLTNQLGPPLPRFGNKDLIARLKRHDLRRWDLRPERFPVCRTKWGYLPAINLHMEYGQKAHAAQNSFRDKYF